MPATANQRSRTAKPERAGCTQSQQPNVRARSSGTSAADWAPAYLKSMATLGQVTKAAKAAKVHPTTVLRRRRSDDAFAQDEREAVQSAVQTFESEAVRRAVQGCTKVRYDRNGNIVSREIEYSDMILLRLLERSETGSWRQKQQVEHSGQMVFKTRAERVAALEAAESAMRNSAVRIPQHGAS